MSLILEALKKSEAERRLGQAPDILTPAPRVAARRPAWIGGFALGLGLALLTLGAAAWWFVGRTPDAVPPAPAAAVADGPAVEGPSVAPSSALPTRAPARRRAP
ncbi:MAG TPA: hypothetical protein PLI44_10000, partial [Chiayiivirga sp.]|nr:hypothetical protein [Chiayiivirga sp.]